MKITKAILTGGGRATRLRPITTTINKHLIPLANQPMIFHAIAKVIEAGVKEIFINTNPGEQELQKVVGDGSRWGIKITYFEQQGGPLGIAHVVKQAEKFIGHDPFIFYLSDNIVLSELTGLLQKFFAGGFDSMLTLSSVPDPERFGVPYFNADGQLIDTKEKPLNPPNNFAITGIYVFGPELFFKAFDHIKPSGRGEYEITDIYSYLLKNDYKVGYEEITGWWKDTGKPSDLLTANALLMDHLPTDYWQYDHVRIGKNCQLNDGVIINGPVIVGDNCTLSGCTIGPHVTIGSGSTISNAEISNSLIFENCNIDGRLLVSDSIMGRKARVFKLKPDVSDGNIHSLILGDGGLAEL